jgi:hypothetical protein
LTTVTILNPTGQLNELIKKYRHIYPFTAFQTQKIGQMLLPHWNLHTTIDGMQIEDIHHLN